ncbi:MAG: hypothetical protein AAGF01_31580 [Cyanobacteria bacterium P01_G01_bin.38]
MAYMPQLSQIDWDYPITAWTVVMMAHTRALSWQQRSKSEIKRSVRIALERVDMFSRYDRLLLLNQRLLANDTPQAVMIMENIQQAYGANIQPAVEGSHSVPFVC